MREVLHLLPAGQPVRPAPGRGLGGVRRAVVGPRRGGRRPGLLAGGPVRARGAARGRDRLRDRGVDGGPRRGPPRPRRGRVRGLATRRVADTLGRVGEAGLTNVRLLSVDAIWSMEHLLGPDSLAALWTFFPDPWPKTPAPQAPVGDPDVRAPRRDRLLVRCGVAAGDRLGRLRHADGGGARRRAAARGWTDGALGRAAGHPVRAQGPRSQSREITDLRYVRRPR